MGKPRRSFTPEFKQNAVDLCRRSGKSECQVAREVGISQSTLNRWPESFPYELFRILGSLRQIRVSFHLSIPA